MTGGRFPAYKPCFNNRSVNGACVGTTLDPETAANRDRLILVTSDVKLMDQLDLMRVGSDGRAHWVEPEQAGAIRL